MHLTVKAELQPVHNIELYARKTYLECTFTIWFPDNFSVRDRWVNIEGQMDERRLSIVVCMLN